MRTHTSHIRFRACATCGADVDDDLDGFSEEDATADWEGRFYGAEFDANRERALRAAALGDVARLRDALSGTLDLLACVWPQARNCQPTCNPIYQRAREILAGVTS